MGTGSKRPGKSCCMKKMEEAERQRGLFEKLQKDLKPGNCLVMAKITFSLFLRQPECHRGSTGGMSNTHCQFPRESKGSRSCWHSRAGDPLQLAFISPKDRA